MDAQNKDGRGLGQGFGEENLLRQWDSCEEMDEMLKCTDILCFSLRPCCLHRLFADKTCSIYDFNLAIFWSDHCNAKLITHFQPSSMDPDIVTFTSPIV